MSENNQGQLMGLSQQVGGLTQAVKTVEKDMGALLKSQQQQLQAITELTQRMNQVPGECHREQHEFLQTLIEERQQRQLLRAEIIRHLAKGSAWAALSGLFGLLALGIKAKYGIGN